MENNILISTGGSGGHVVPAIVLYKHLSKKMNVIISTDKRGLRYLNKKIQEIEIIDTPKLNNIFFLPYNFLIIFYLTIKSIFFFKKKKVNKIISTGGYMSLPLILAGNFLKIEIYLFEPNLILGRANKFFLKSCKKIFCFTEKIKNFPVKYYNKKIIIKPLIREEFYNLVSNTSNNKKTNLLIVGGSQGAKFFDENLKNIIINISKDFPIKVVQQSNIDELENLKNFYSKNNVENKIFTYDENFIDLVKNIDLCITRGGASTLAELSLLNIPFIVIPLPSSKDNHQFENANYYKDKNCCWIIKQNSLQNDGEKLLRHILQDKNEYLKKKENLKELNYQNTWINVNQKILSIINEN